MTGRDSDTLKTVRHAIDQRQIMLAFQPVVQATLPDRIVFHEAMLRVMDESGQIIPAANFIPLVENSDLGRDLDCIALEKGLDELETFPALRLAINMSVRTIGHAGWMRILTKRLQNNPTLGERLILEITEHSAWNTQEKIGAFMQDLQSRGVAFAIDDFGVGYTSLRHFRDYKFDILKIDESYISGISSNREKQVLVRAMTSIAKQLDLLSVAEGVEQPEDAAVLVEFGINCLQGYHYAPPTLAPLWRPMGQQVVL